MKHRYRYDLHQNAQNVKPPNMPCIEFSATTMKNAPCLGCILNLPCSRKLERHFYDLFLDAFSLTEWLQVACGSVCIDLVTVSSSLSGSNSLSKTEGGTCFDITDLDWQVHANWPGVHITISNHGLRWVWMKWDSLPPAILSSSSGRLILI